MSKNTNHDNGLYRIDREVLDKALNTDEIEAVKEREMRSHYHRNWIIMCSAVGLILVIAVVSLLALI